MKKILAILVIVGAAGTASAQPPVGPANIGDTYGEKTSSKGIVAPARLNKDLAKKDTVEAKVAAKVLDVCPKKGCWMQVELADKSKMFVKFKDYAFFVPMDMIGKEIVLDGIAFSKMTSVAELKHYAEDAKKSQAEIDAIKEPKKEVRFLADGVLVVK